MLTLNGDDPDKVRRVLDIVAAFKGKSRADLLGELRSPGAEDVAVSSLARRVKFPSHFVEKLTKYIGGLKPHEQAFIVFELDQNAIAGLSTAELVAGGAALQHLQGWLTVDMSSRSRFLTHCTDANGHYLLFRMVDDEQISVSEMQVSRAARGLFPTFVTTRRVPVEKTVRGAIFQSGETVYAVGQIRNDDGVRFSRLSFRPRGDFTDLYGLRCGHSDSRPLAHLLYAYQLAADDKRDLTPLLEATDPKAPVFKSIDGFDHILTLIKAKGLEEGGLMAHKIR